jgi:hypothetical protein
MRRLVVHKMNIFYLDSSASISAKLHCDKHVVKMIVEYAQLLSTAHRVLDGELYIDSSSGRKIKRWQHPDSDFEANLYKACFVNHPSAVWVRESPWNYNWLHALWYSLCGEYTYRYNKDHATYLKLAEYLQDTPKNLFFDKEATVVPQCMPDDVKADDPVDAYQNYYVQYKKDFARWTNRPTPKFMQGLR